MAAKQSETLYGNVPEKSAVVLLLIDVINDLNFPHGDVLLRQALPMAANLAKLKARTKKHGFAAIYVNDNFGRWRSDFRSQVDHCLNHSKRGRELTQTLFPENDDYFVLKPAHSGFFSTSLEILLKHLDAKTLIVSGIATDICVLFTVNDAFLRGYDVWVPRDCVAANTRKLTSDALAQMSRSAKAKTSRWQNLPWSQWTNQKSEGRNRV